MQQSTAVVPAEANLQQLADRANQQHRLYKSRNSSAIRHACKCGRTLLRAKKLVGHGEWSTWLKSNFIGSERTAQAYLRIAKNWPAIKAKSADETADLTLDGALKLLAERNELDARFSSNSDNWPTPQPLFDQFNREFGFTLDVCASSDNAKCGRYFTADDDGLAQDWSGEVCWMNPPYGDQIGRWMQKAQSEAQRGATVVCLVPARTDTHWWHDHATGGEIRFLQGRVKFVGTKSAAPFPSAVIVFSRPAPRQRQQPEPLCLSDALTYVDRLVRKVSIEKWPQPYLPTLADKLRSLAYELDEHGRLGWSDQEIQVELDAIDDDDSEQPALSVVRMPEEAVA